MKKDDDLVMAFQSTADWRRQKAEEYRDDRRNGRAAELLERLATTVKDIPSELRALYDGMTDDFPSEFQSEQLRAVGFNYFPDSATEFVQGIIHASARGAEEVAVEAKPAPAPNLTSNLPTPPPPAQLEIGQGVVVDTVYATVAQWRLAKLHSGGLLEIYRDSIASHVNFADGRKWGDDEVLFEKLGALVRDR
jgi:hypothetical protein